MILFPKILCHTDRRRPTRIYSQSKEEFSDFGEVFAVTALLRSGPRVFLRFMACRPPWAQKIALGSLKSAVTVVLTVLSSSCDFFPRLPWGSQIFQGLVKIVVF